jgi:hypothetical protein
VEAVRSRVKRGSNAHEREGGRLHVLLDTDQSRPGHDQGNDQPTDQAQPDALIEALDEMREQVRYLREQVQAEREAHAEARHLLLLALERIPPALEPPSQEEPQESPSEATPQPGRVEPQPATSKSTQEAQESHEMHMPEVHGVLVSSPQSAPGGGGCSVAEGLRLEDWIGKEATVNLHKGPAAEPDNELVAIEGILEGVDPMGVIVLFSSRAVAGKRGRALPPQDMPARYVFYPWRGVELVERVEAKDIEADD